MNVPARIRIGYRDYDVYELDRHTADSEDKFGDCDANRAVIRVSHDFGPVKAANVLLHETLHAAWSTANLAPKETEERVVQCLADVLCQMWRDNPDFVRFMDESLGGRV